MRSTLRLINDTSPYGLTGSMFACNRDIVQKIMDILQHAAVYFYIDNKSTGSVQGQQPFGGFRLVGLSGWGFRWVGLSGWRFKWLRLQVGGAPLDKLSVVHGSSCRC